MLVSALASTAGAGTVLLLLGALGTTVLSTRPANNGIGAVCDNDVGCVASCCAMIDVLYVCIDSMS